ncbi:sulfite exporter TauE/SafE family protein [Streptomyces sp. TRM 70361]|uniref:sulfite exporter TauE/SafE family protein n=1 Tax=Streptomyces sp. TRM 70361 TaxID=3116553 RepID=UPI002E7B43B6|nr:sulfite exporter TauE/SafE family protein [Streptomyces sp. TRM 70361]MEE1938082.1 sulfite exporter TauE/SafE family protein [Streptomyces sp. TRM 70361]
MTLGAEHLVIISVLAFFAYGLKGLTGFGPALLFVPVASVLFNQPLAVAASGVLDATSGAALTAADARIRRGREGLLIGTTMAVGTAVGVVVLSLVPGPASAAMLVLAILVGLASVVAAQLKGPVEQSRKTGPRGGAVGLLAGFTGGVTGISGPPLVIYLQRVLTPHDLRIVVTRVLLISAVVRVATFLAVGDGIASAMLLALVCLPMQLVGILTGSRLSRRTSPRSLATVNSAIVAASVLLAACNAFWTTGVRP